jgi:hypothetical protein
MPRSRDTPLVLRGSYLLCFEVVSSYVTSRVVRLGCPYSSEQFPLNTESTSAREISCLGFRVVESGTWHATTVHTCLNDDARMPTNSLVYPYYILLGGDRMPTNSLVYPYYILLGGDRTPRLEHAYEELHDALHAPNNGLACMHSSIGAWTLGCCSPGAPVLIECSSQ